MLTLTLEPIIQTKLEQFAQIIDQSVEEIVNQAINQYLEKIEIETKSYERLHPQLKDSYLGQYVAIHKGQVVDVDVDYSELIFRIEAQYGDIAILIRKVKRTLAKDYCFFGIKFFKAAKQYETGLVSLGQAARLANMNRLSFLQNLGQMDIVAINLQDEQIEAEIQAAMDLAT